MLVSASDVDVTCRQNADRYYLAYFAFARIATTITERMQALYAAAPLHAARFLYLFAGALGYATAVTSRTRRMRE